MIVIRVPKLSSTSQASHLQTWTFKDHRDHNIEWTVQCKSGHRLTTDSGGEYVWEIRIKAHDEESNYKVFAIRSVALVESCDRDRGNLSARLNGKLPRVVYDGSTYYTFAASCMSYAKFEIDAPLMKFARVATPLAWPDDNTQVRVDFNP